MTRPLRDLDGRRFTKGHGTENDFVLFMDPEGEMTLSEADVRALCDRRAGIGADGVIRAVLMGAAERTPELPEGFADDVWFMDYRNSDGSISEMCGNGARVFAALLEREAGEDLSGGLEIATRAGARILRALGGGDYSVTMGAYELDAAGAFDAEVAVRGLDGESGGTSVDVGNPHTVVRLDSLEELEALDLSVAPAVTPVPPHGSNVEFVVMGASGEVTMRVHERGSGETRSCGTGACAVALAARAWTGAGAPDVWRVRVPGGSVTVRIEGGGTVLEGPAVLVADGVLGG